MAMTGDSVLLSDPRLVLSDRVWAYDSEKARQIVGRLFRKTEALTSYRCTILNFYHQKSLLPDEWLTLSVRYPKTIRIDLLRPRRGAALVYRRSTGLVRVKPFGFLSFRLTLSPRNSLLVSRFGHTIDHSDFESFTRRILKPACLARACLYLGKGIWKGRPVDILNVAPDVLEAHRIFGMMLILVNKQTGFPVMIETISPLGDFMERVEYRNCQTNVLYPQGYFKL